MLFKPRACAPRNRPDRGARLPACRRQRCCENRELRADAAINGKLRPLYFSSSRLGRDALATISASVSPADMAWVGRMSGGFDPIAGCSFPQAASPTRSRPTMASRGRTAVCRALLEDLPQRNRYAELKG